MILLKNLCGRISDAILKRFRSFRITTFDKYGLQEIKEQDD